MPEAVNFMCRMKPYIQPFERDLALRELEYLSNAKAIQYPNDQNCFSVKSNVSPEHLLERLAYWEYIKDGRLLWTKQLKREATTAILKNGIKPSELNSILPFKNEIPVPNKRCLRYGPHDIHDYRGKFFPQLVRVLMNFCDLPVDSIILDPMCGSGTTLVEANLSGFNAIGIDLNPLSVFISKTKCEIIRESPTDIINEFDKIKSTLLKIKTKQEHSLSYFNTLPSVDQQYLKSWFPERVLYDLDEISSLLDTMPPSASRNLFCLCLSDILRSVSYQKTDDLRIRREIKSVNEIDTFAKFIEHTNRTVKYLVAFLLEEKSKNQKKFSVVCGDARNLRTLLNDDKNMTIVDAVITSPPYATALPYLDTDRLSLCYLKLLPRNRYRIIDYQMIGNREISENQRVDLWNKYLNQQVSLPREICDLISEVYQAYRDNDNNDVGFRRKNLPSLLAKYFLDMREVMSQVNSIVRQNGHMFIVVGDNHTIAHGKRINIQTAKLIGLLGQSVGMRLLEYIPMDMLIPRDIFKKNSVASEYIVHLQACH